MQAIRERFSFMRGNMLVLTVRQVIGMFCRQMVFPYASLFILSVGGTSEQIGVVNSLRPLAGLLMFPLSGYLTDRAGRVKLIALAGYLGALGMLLYVFAPSWEWIALGALIQGFMVFQFPPTSAMLADSLSVENRGTGIATMNMLATAFSMFSPYIAGVLLDALGVDYGMRVLYGLLAFSSLVGAVLVSRYMRETVEREGFGSLPPVGTILRESYSGIPGLLGELPLPVKALGVVMALGFIGNAVSSPFWVVFVVDEIGLSSTGWGLILLLETILKTVLIIPAGVLVDERGRSRVLLFAVLVSLVSMPAMIFARGFYDVLLIRLVTGVAGALLVPASTALMADYVPSELRGRVMAAIGRGSLMVGSAGGGTGGPGMGYLFTVPVMAGSILGGVLYALDPSYPWVCLFALAALQAAAIMLYVRDPEEAH
ncbi:MFS transporter [Candidatus Bathyarchaeota archaeon]|nr:MFS transporter [Candidatus Bathyarchaeota archaeon]